MSQNHGQGGENMLTCFGPACWPKASDVQREQQEQRHRGPEFCSLRRSTSTGGSRQLKLWIRRLDRSLVVPAESNGDDCAVRRLDSQCGPPFNEASLVGRQVMSLNEKSHRPVDQHPPRWHVPAVVPYCIGDRLSRDPARWPEAQHVQHRQQQDPCRPERC